MAVLFSLPEIVNVALGIERNGLAFYQALADSTKDNRIQATYSYLADMEREHIDIFQEMLVKLDRDIPPDTYNEEYDSYLKSLIDSAVFRHTGAAREMAGKAPGNKEAIQIAIGAEKDSILFYSEMRHLLPVHERKAVDKIIREERSHLRHLSEVQATLKTP